jgi:chromosomal replication initiation ATPase DnaA
MIDYYTKYLDVTRKLNSVQKINESRIRELEKEIHKLKIQIINPIKAPIENKQMMEILQAVSEATMVTQHDIIGLERKRSISVVRYCFIYIAKEYNFTLAEIARFVNRHHATVIHALGNYEHWLSVGYKYETKIYKDAKEILERL